MSDIYTYSVQGDFPNQKVDAGRLTMEINSSDISISLDHIDIDSVECNITFKASLPSNDKTILDGLVANHSGEPYEDEAAPTDPTNKPRVQATPRPLGLDTYFTGAGDNPDNIKDIGGGQRLVLYHKVGDDATKEIFIDFNIIENGTWILEGKIKTIDARFDYVDFDIVNRAMAFAPGSDTQFTALPNGFIIPANGDGNINLTGDWTLPNGGLIFMPDDDQKNPPMAFWDATWNTEIGKYENLTAAPTGNGRYNMIVASGVMKEFINRYNLLGDCNDYIHSYDSAQMGQGMRLRLTINTETTLVPDHEWMFAANITMYRKKTT